MTPLNEKDPLNSSQSDKELEKQETLSFQEWLEKDLPDQYQKKAQILNKVGVVQIISDDRIGIIGFNGKEYPFPEFKTIQDKVKENSEFFETKFKQGFTELEIVPFALPISRLIEILKIQLLSHEREDKLFKARKNKTDPREPFELNKNHPVFLVEEYRSAETNGNFVYAPREFTDNHQGKTKEEELQTLEKSGLPGYLIVLREKNTNISRKNQGIILGGRKPLETNLTPKKYLEILITDPVYQGESGQTIEEWLTQFITHLEETNEVLDDSENYGSKNSLIGTFYYKKSHFATFSSVPTGSSFGGFQVIILQPISSSKSNDKLGTRSTIKINKT
jgi:hypothetical protein